MIEKPVSHQNVSLNTDLQCNANSGQYSAYSFTEHKIRNKANEKEEMSEGFLKKDNALLRLTNKAIDEADEFDEHTKFLKRNSSNLEEFVGSPKCSLDSSFAIQSVNNNNSFYINNNKNQNKKNDIMCDGNYENNEELILEDEPIANFDSDVSEKQIQLEKLKKGSRIGHKTVGLKRVSFGSSKGSMVETLVFETPTPLVEHAEPVFGFQPTNTYLPIDSMDDSGIDLHEELQRSIVRVSIYQSNQPRQICQPEIINTLTWNQELQESVSTDYCWFEDNMTAAGTMSCDRQESIDSGWDNPFRPGGDLSREADEIVNMIKGGKPITPTEDPHIGNGNSQKEEYCNEVGVTAIDGITKKNVTQSSALQNGNTLPLVQATERPPGSNGTTQAQVSNKVVPGPTSASHVVIDEKKTKKGCCVIQ